MRVRRLVLGSLLVVLVLLVVAGAVALLALPRIVRTVTVPGADPRVLNLTSTYQPSRNIIMVGTG